MTDLIKLENWGVVYKDNAWTPPEFQRIALHGKAYGHHRHEDGTEVTTTAIKSTDGRTVTTVSGSVYILGEPDPEYARIYPQVVESDNPVRFVMRAQNDETE